MTIPIPCLNTNCSIGEVFSEGVEKKSAIVYLERKSTSLLGHELSSEYPPEINEYSRKLANCGITLLVCPTRGTTPANLPVIEIIDYANAQAEVLDQPIPEMLEGFPAALRLYHLRHQELVSLAKRAKNTSLGSIRGCRAKVSRSQWGQGPGPWIISTDLGTAMCHMEAEVMSKSETDLVEGLVETDLPGLLLKIECHSGHKSRVYKLLEENFSLLHSFKSPDSLLWESFVELLPHGAESVVVITVRIVGGHDGQLWQPLASILTDFFQRANICSDEESSDLTRIEVVKNYLVGTYYGSRVIQNPSHFQESAATVIVTQSEVLGAQSSTKIQIVVPPIRKLLTRQSAN